MRLIDADALNEAMYDEAFENDESYNETNPMARWDSGLWIRYKMFENILKEAPTIEPTIEIDADQLAKLLREGWTIHSEPKQGEWIDKGWHGDWQFEIDGRGNCWKEFECSNCNCRARYITPFCPHCGARMKGADDE